MGRSYWFECSKCGYRAKVSGREDAGINFAVQTILCHDCKALYDAVTRLRVPDERKVLDGLSGAGRTGLPAPRRSFRAPPDFQSVLSRLPHKGVRRFRWIHFKLQCPVSAAHRVRSWNDPDRCPRCGLYLEKNALPYRLWD